MPNTREKRLIDANALCENIKKRYCEVCKAQGKDYKEVLCRACDIDDMCSEIDVAPTVDAKPVVHGRWIHITEDGKGGCYGFCSNCSTEHHAQSASALKAFHRYCRWCGADMR